MTTFYLDSSALIKRYVQETGSDWIRGLVSPGEGHTFLTARVSMVEIYSALARRQREGSVPVADCIIAAEAFTEHSEREYEFVEVDTRTISVARTLLERHPLRAYDALQLASAVIANQALRQVQLPELVLLSADDRLLAVAAAERLTTDNPNHY